MWTIPLLTPFDFRETLLYFPFFFIFVMCSVLLFLACFYVCIVLAYVLFISIEDNVSFRFGGVRLLVIVLLT